MHDVSRHLVDRVLPDVPIRQYVLSPPSDIVGLLAARSEVLGGLSRCFLNVVFAGLRSRLSTQAHGQKLHFGAVVFVQRFSKALSCFPHLHVLVLDGGYVEEEEDPLRFIEAPGPSQQDIARLEQEVMTRFSRWLKRHGYLETDAAEQDDDDAWWLAGVRQPSGMLRTVNGRRPAKFSVDAGVRIRAGDQRGREQLCRYVARPPLAEGQITELDQGRVGLTFRRPASSGQTDLVLEPVALMAKLAWLVPPPKQHQLRYAGVLAPAARLRPIVVPAGRVSIQATCFGPRPFEATETVLYRVPWARLIHRVYDVDAHQCPNCGGRLRPVEAVLPPEAHNWIDLGRIRPLPGSDPPTQLPLPLRLIA